MPSLLVAVVPRVRAANHPRAPPKLVLACVVLLLLALAVGTASARPSSSPRRALHQKTTTMKPATAAKNSTTTTTTTTTAARTISATAQANQAVVRAMSPALQQQAGDVTPVAVSESISVANPSSSGSGLTASGFVPGIGPSVAVAQAASTFNRPLYGYGGGYGYGGPGTFFYGGSGGAWGWAGGRFASG